MRNSFLNAHKMNHCLNHYRSQPIHVIGDSHANLFTGVDEMQPAWPEVVNHYLPCFRGFRLGPVLAYNLCQVGSSSYGRERLFTVLKTDVPKRAKVMLCFGEIDCRAHLLKQKNLVKATEASVVVKCVERYFSVVLEVASLGFETIVWNVIPPVRHDVPGDLPSYGTNRDRDRMSRLFNSFLDRHCHTAGLRFISVYDDLIDSDANCKEEYYWPNDVHLSQRAMPLVLRAFKLQYPELNWDMQPVPNKIRSPFALKLAYWYRYARMVATWRKMRVRPHWY